MNGPRQPLDEMFNDVPDDYSIEEEMDPYSAQEVIWEDDYSEEAEYDYDYE
jgi:hypothetical protein